MPDLDVEQSASAGWPVAIIMLLMPCCCIGYCVGGDDDDPVQETPGETLAPSEHVNKIESFLTSGNYAGAKRQLEMLASQPGADRARVRELGARIERERGEWLRTRESKRLDALRERLSKAVDARDVQELDAIASNPRFAAMATGEAYEAVANDKLAKLESEWGEKLPRDRELLAILCIERERLVGSLAQVFKPSQRADAFVQLTASCAEAVKKRPVKPGVIGKSRAYLEAIEPGGRRHQDWVEYTDSVRYHVYAYHGEVKDDTDPKAAKLEAVYITTEASTSGRRRGISKADALELIERYAGGSVKAKKLDRNKDYIAHRRFKTNGQRVEVGFYGPDIIEITIGKLSLRSRK